MSNTPEARVHSSMSEKEMCRIVIHLEICIRRSMLYPLLKKLNFMDHFTKLMLSHRLDSYTYMTHVYIYSEEISILAAPSCFWILGNCHVHHPISVYKLTHLSMPMNHRSEEISGQGDLSASKRDYSDRAMH